jgi:hypothetical protein
VYESLKNQDSCGWGLYNRSFSIENSTNFRWPQPVRGLFVLAQNYICTTIQTCRNLIPDNWFDIFSSVQVSWCAQYTKPSLFNLSMLKYKPIVVRTSSSTQLLKFFSAAERCTRKLNTVLHLVRRSSRLPL